MNINSPLTFRPAASFPEISQKEAELKSGSSRPSRVAAACANVTVVSGHECTLCSLCWMFCRLSDRKAVCLRSMKSESARRRNEEIKRRT